MNKVRKFVLADGLIPHVRVKPNSQAKAAFTLVPKGYVDRVREKCGSDPILPEVQLRRFLKENGGLVADCKLRVSEFIGRSARTDSSGRKYLCKSDCARLLGRGYSGNVSEKWLTKVPDESQPVVFLDDLREYMTWWDDTPIC